MRRDVRKALHDLRRTGRRHPTAASVAVAAAVMTGVALGRLVPARGTAPQARTSSPSAPDHIDLRDEYRERPGQAPQLDHDVQEWVRP